jgi:uncharacterized protein (TIRG00374 family)
LKRNLKYLIQYAAFVGFGFLLLYFAYRDENFNALWNGIKDAHFGWIALTILMGYLAIVSRGLRWNMLIEPLGMRASSANCIHAVNFSYFTSTFVPRSGELARCVALNQTDSIPVEKLFGTVIMERIIDSIILLSIIIIAIGTHIDAFQNMLATTETGEVSATESKGLWLAVFGAIAIFFILFLTVRKRLRRYAFYQRLAAFAEGLIAGIKSVFSIRQKLLFIAHTLFIWLMYFLSAYFVAYSLEATAGMGISDALFIVVAGGLGMVFPSPGGTGSYQFAVKLAFIALGYSGEVGLQFATIVWVTQTLMILITGLFSALALYLARRKKTISPSYVSGSR